MRALVLLAIAAAISIPLGVQAHESEPHHEIVTVGPYVVEVGFSQWPPLAERSFDITLMPEGGLEGKTATALFESPSGGFVEANGAVGRHPRMREYWGFDLIALPEAGEWSIDLTVNGPEGEGRGTIGPFTVGARPGPPPAPMWVIGLLPLVGIAIGAVVSWRRIRPGTLPEATEWSPAA